MQPVQPTDEAFIIPSCTVLLTPEGDPDNTVEVSIPVNGSRTFGRNQKAAVVLNAADNALSGLHFELQWDGRVLYLADRNSTNGTALNGSPQRPGHWARVESGAVIQAGSGVDAKFMIEDGIVSVNGEVELRRGRKVRPGDVIELEGHQVKVNHI